MLIVHHLERAQSERIVWMCEELGLDYELKTYPRDPKTHLAPPELAALTPTKGAPVIQDGDVTLGESGAIAEYILTKYDPDGKLVVRPNEKNWVDYLYFMHFSNSYFQPALMRWRTIKAFNGDPESPQGKFAQRGFKQSLSIIEDKLGKTKWLAGDKFSAADVMVVTSLTTMRLFIPYSLAEYPNILAFLKTVSEREAYKRACEKGDPGFEPVLGAEPPKH